MRLSLLVKLPLSLLRSTPLLLNSELLLGYFASKDIPHLFGCITYPILSLSLLVKSPFWILKPAPFCWLNHQNHLESSCLKLEIPQNHHFLWLRQHLSWWNPPCRPLPRAQPRWMGRALHGTGPSAPSANGRRCGAALGLPGPGGKCCGSGVRKPQELRIFWTHQQRGFWIPLMVLLMIWMGLIP